jgi:hypothetical protein
VVVVELPDDSHTRKAEQLGQRHARGRLDRVRGLDAAEDEVRLLLLDHLGEGSSDRDRIAIGRFLDRDANAAIGSHGEAASHCLLRILVAGGDDHHLTLPAEALPDLERLLGCERVPFVQGEVEEVRIDALPIVGELDLVPEHRHLLRADDDLHRASTPRRRANFRSPRPSASPPPRARSPDARG